MARIKVHLVITIFVTLFSFGFPQPAGDYRSFCQKTSYGNVCVQVIDAFVSNAKLKQNINGWLQILSFRAIAFALTTNTKIGDALRNTTDPDLKTRLNICKQRLGITYSYLNKIDWTLLSHDNYPQYNRQVVLALGAVDDCIQGFNLPTPIQSPVAILSRGTDDAVKLVLEGVHIFQCNRKTEC